MTMKLTLAVTAISIAVWILPGCQQPIVNHKLVVTGNEHSVPMYPDEQTYMNVSHEKQQGGISGMVGNVNKKFNAKEIDDQTPINVVSSDDNGAMVQVTSGPMKGSTGFVPRQNVD